MSTSISIYSTNASCHTSTPEDACFVHAQWAHSIGLHSHPEWYPGLQASATFEDLQRFMHNKPTELKKYGCAVPCRPPPWEDPLVNHRRREPPHSVLHPFESEALSVGHALDVQDLEDSSRVLMLSGTEARWSFAFTGEIHKRPSVHRVPFHAPAFNDSSWHRIAVPSNWEMLGHGVPSTSKRLG